MNLHAVGAIYMAELARTQRTWLQSIVSPVISTSLYFIVFGAAIGSRISTIEGVSYGAFIVPGLMMLMLLTQSVSNASIGIYFPRFAGTIYENGLRYRLTAGNYVCADNPKPNALTVARHSVSRDNLGITNVVGFIVYHRNYGSWHVHPIDASKN